MALAVELCPGVVVFDRVAYPTVEHAYQAAKTIDDEERARVAATPSPGRAKRLGKSLTLRPDWDAVRLGIMRDLLRQKFNHPEYQRMLLATGDAELVEGNVWGDTFWGICDGVGENYLGRLLMQVREELLAVG